MAATSVREPEISLHTVERPLDLVGVSELELARLLTWETTDEHNAVDQIAWQMLQHLKPAHLITHRFPLANASQAYALLDQHPEEAIQVVLTYES